MLATSSSSNFTPFRQRADRTGSCGGFSLRSTLSTEIAAAVFAYSLSIAFHLSRFFATLIHVLLLFISFPVVVSVSSGLRNSLISSSHLFFGLSTGLFVWYLGAETWVPCIWKRYNPRLQSAISFFCVFESSMGFGLLSSFQLL